jgi:exodeoxyribonuclease V alpha subunit
LAGLVDRVTFHKLENGFCVLRVKARGQRDLITVVRHAGDDLGRRVHPSERLLDQRPHAWGPIQGLVSQGDGADGRGDRKCLGSGMIRGIGPVYVKKLVRAFGETVFEIIEQEPGRLREVTGIGRKRAERIRAGACQKTRCIA